MSVQFSIDQRGLQRALTTYAVTRRKSDADVVNKAMRYVLPAAARRVKDKTRGVVKVRRELRARARNPIASKFKRGKGSWAGTLAAAIIAARLKKRGVLGKQTPDFWEMVDRFADAKMRSVNYLRAGFIPAFRHFHVPNLKAPGHTHFKGRSKGIKAVPSLTGVAEAFATNQREGAFKIAPRAFHEAVRDVQRLFLRWLRSDVEATAKRSGFY